MRTGRLYRGDECIVPNLRIARTWTARARGLIFGQALASDGSDALLLSPCGSIHTFGMRYGIDVVFLDKKGRVLSIRENIMPWRVCLQSGASEVVEFRSGATARLRMRVGECVQWRD